MGRGSETATLFRGEIVGLEMDLDAAHMPTISVRAYDRSHRLHRGRTSRTFVQMSDTDIVQKIGQEMGFTVTAKATPIVHDWLMQNNQTNWEFLSECATRCAFRLFLKGERELHFEPIDYYPGVGVRLPGRPGLAGRAHRSRRCRSARCWRPTTSPTPSQIRRPSARSCTRGR